MEVRYSKKFIEELSEEMLKLSPKAREAADKVAKEFCDAVDQEILNHALKFARDPKDFI